MKKVLLAAASLLFALSALAQGPATASAKRPDQETAKEHKYERKQQDEKTAPDNHGQQVQAFAHATTLTGADKGAAISTLARTGHAETQSIRHMGSARGERGHHGNHAGGGHQGVGHQHGAGHRGGH